MFLTLFAHTQEALIKRHLVYYVRVMSAGCTRIGVSSTPILLQQTDVTHMQHCVTSPEDEQVVLETYRGP
jgi:hypothetical protein